MKLKILGAVLTVATLWSCSHFGGKRKVASDDVGLIGPQGEVVLYYKEGNYIMVKNCEQNTVLGATPLEARANCEGKSNKVPLETFKQAIRNLVSTDRLNILKPLTSDEVQAYNKDGPSSSDIEKMVVELDKINAFITAYGPENANLVRKDELVRSLKSTETKVSAIKKINTEIDKAIKLITDDSVLTLKKFSADGDQFLYTVLKNFDPSQKYPCGLSGSVDERIKDCSVQETSSIGNFVLVSRSKEFKEVYKDTKSQLLWSDRLASKMTHYDAQKACKADLKEVAGVTGSWRLPSIDEYKTAESNGIRKGLPNMNYWFWSSSVHQSYSDGAWLFNGSNGVVDDVYRNYNDSVRCVAP